MNEAQAPLEFAADDSRAGFRLHRLEIFNWGTFHNRVWTLDLDGHDALLTGDIGSGKSTIIDAVTTLLVPPGRIAYNRAAGADSNERSLRSYVLGHYKSGRSDVTGGGRPIALRDHNNYSVILGRFHNAGLGQTVTLAQVFWISDHQGQPARFYIAADRALSIAADFAEFGKAISDLRRRMRSQEVATFDSFVSYSAHFRRRFGISDEQALELFHQTVSMKSVGNLTDFVRQHMLEPFDATARIDALLAHFDDLTSAYQAVLGAKRQVERLTPLVADIGQHEADTQENQDARAARNALRSYFARIRIELLDERLAKLAAELERHAAQITKLEEEQRALQARERSLRRSIAENGGDRIAQLDEDITRATESRERSKEKARRYATHVRRLGLEPAGDLEGFLAQRDRLAELREGVASREAALQNQRHELGMQRAHLEAEYTRVTEEIDGLKARRSNIPERQVALRRELCSALGLPEDELPFAGELIRVRDEARNWEGAAERLLHSFGLSLLVPDNHYSQVAAWVDRKHLSGRLVYFRVRQAVREDQPEPHGKSLLHALELKGDSAFHPWLEREVTRRFDFIRCDDQQEFQRQPRAITLSGQIKSPGGRHEKDDRHRIDDRSRFVLGWSNQEKIAVLEDTARQQQGALAELHRKLEQIEQASGTIMDQLRALASLEEYGDHSELDWRSAATRIERLLAEKQQLEKSSSVLRELALQLEATEAEQLLIEKHLQERRNERARTEQKRDHALELRAPEAELAAAGDFALHAVQFGQITSWREQALPQRAFTVESCDAREREFRDWLQARIDVVDKRLVTLQERIIGNMNTFRAAFPLAGRELDASLAAGPAYRKLLEQLRADDLPRFETNFKKLLNENTIREIANFQAQLSRERDTIRERIERINASLRGIDYNPGRFIELQVQDAADAEIRDFRNELRSCTEGTSLGIEDDPYAEQKFLQVKRILERFRGRDGFAEADRRWTAKVTDVRTWFSFAASEKWRDTNDEHEHYSDSGGKSGGQKEKLAYTVLAASLAYRFGLEAGQVRSRSFRFVTIDEAFGRGSDESARYGLQLFSSLGLQLLIATPLQKIHVIEPFVASVGFVQSKDGRESLLRNLGIEEYRTERDRHREREAGAATLDTPPVDA
jgi:uncharacterized protein YPO0396